MPWGNDELVTSATAVVEPPRSPFGNDELVTPAMPTSVPTVPSAQMPTVAMPTSVISTVPTSATMPPASMANPAFSLGPAGGRSAIETARMFGSPEPQPRPIVSGQPIAQGEQPQSSTLGVLGKSLAVGTTDAAGSVVSGASMFVGGERAKMQIMSYASALQTAGLSLLAPKLYDWMNDKFPELRAVRNQADMDLKARLREAGSWIKSKTPDQWRQEVANVAGKDISLSGEGVTSLMANVAMQIPLIATTYVAQAVGGAAGFATAGPVGAQVGKHMAGYAVMAAAEADTMYEACRTLKLSQPLAEKYAQIYGLGSGVIEYMQELGRLGTLKGKSTAAIKKEGAKLFKRVVADFGGSIGEGFEELSQNTLQNYLLQLAVDEQKGLDPTYAGVAPKLGEGGLKSFLLATATGGLVRGAGAVRDVAGSVANRGVEAARQKAEFDALVAAGRMSQQEADRQYNMAMAEAAVGQQSQVQPVQQTAGVAPGQVSSQIGLAPGGFTGQVEAGPMTTEAAPRVPVAPPPTVRESLSVAPTVAENAPVAPQGEAKKPQKEYRYQLQLRPASTSTVPEGFARLEDDGTQFGSVVYDKPLTQQQQRDFSLTPMDPLDPANIKKAVTTEKARIDKETDYGEKSFEVDGELYSPDPRRGGEAWRVTTFDNGGPTGHREFDSYQEARDDAAGAAPRPKPVPQESPNEARSGTPDQVREVAGKPVDAAQARGGEPTIPEVVVPEGATAGNAEPGVVAGVEAPDAQGHFKGQTGTLKINNSKYPVRLHGKITIDAPTGRNPKATREVWEGIDLTSNRVIRINDEANFTPDKEQKAQPAPRTPEVPEVAPVARPAAEVATQASQGAGKAALRAERLAKQGKLTHFRKVVGKMGYSALLSMAMERGVAGPVNERTAAKLRDAILEWEGLAAAPAEVKPSPEEAREATNESVRQRNTEKEKALAEQQAAQRSQREASEARAGTLPVFRKANGWEIVKDKDTRQYILRNPYTGEEVYRNPKYNRIVQVADQGMPEKPETPAPAAEGEKAQGKAEGPRRVISEDRYQKAKAKFNEKRLTAGLDLDKLAAAVEIGLYHAENIIRKAGKLAKSAWFKAMRADAKELKPGQLRQVWGQMHKDNGARLAEIEAGVGKAEAVFGYKPTVETTESDMLKNVLKMSARDAAVAYRAGGKDFQNTMTQLITEIEKNIPADQQGDFFRTIKNARTPAQIGHAWKKIQEAAREVVAVQARTDFLAVEAQVKPAKMTDEATREAALSIIGEYHATVADLTPEEVSSLTEALKGILHADKIAKQLIGGERVQAVEESAGFVVEELNKRPDIKSVKESTPEKGRIANFFTNTLLDGAQHARRLGLAAMDTLWRKIAIDGNDKAKGVMKEAENLVKTAVETAGHKWGTRQFAKWAQERTDWKLDDGTTARITRGEKLELVAQARDLELRAKITKNGIGPKKNRAAEYHPTSNDLNDLANSLTPGEKGIVDALFGWMNTNGRDYVNEPTRALFGIEKARRKGYYPSHAATWLRGQTKEAEVVRTSGVRRVLEGSGLLKPRVAHGTPMAYGDIFTEFVDHASVVGNIYGKAVPIRDGLALMGNPEVQNAIRNKLGEQEFKFWDRYFSAASGIDDVKTTGFDRFWLRLSGRVAGAKLVNLTSALVQKGGLAIAADYIPSKYILKAQATAFHHGEFKKWMDENSPSLWWRYHGSAAKMFAPLFGTKEPAYGRKGKVQKIMELPVFGISRADMRVSDIIVKAARFQLQAENPGATEAEVAKWAEEVIARSQNAVDSENHSGAALAARESPLLAQFLIFQSQPNKIFNTFYEAVQKAKETDSKAEKAKYIAVAVRGAVLNAAWSIAVRWTKRLAIASGAGLALGAFMDDDDKKGRFTAWTASMDMLQEMLDTMYGVGTAFRTIRNAMNGWDADINTMTGDTVNDAIAASVKIGTTLKQAATGEKYQQGNRKYGTKKGDSKALASAPKALEQAARTFGPLLGVPTDLGIDIIKTVNNAVKEDQNKAAAERGRRLQGK